MEESDGAQAHYLYLTHETNGKKAKKKNQQKKKHQNRKPREATISLHNRVSVLFHFIFALISRTITMLFCYVVPNSFGLRLCLSSVVSVVARFFYFLLVLFIALCGSDIDMLCTGSAECNSANVNARSVTQTDNALCSYDTTKKMLPICVAAVVAIDSSS